MKRTKLLIALLPILLQGCATYYDATKEETQRVRRIAAEPIRLPVPPRAQCIKTKFAKLNANPGKLLIAVDEFDTTALPLTVATGNTPQPKFVYVVQHALIDLGFSVPWAIKRSMDQPAPGKYILSGGLTAYTPLARSTGSDDSIDLLVLGAEREQVVAYGKTRATATLYAANADEYLSFASAESETVFFQVRGKDSISVANKNGWISGGTAREQVEVMSSQDAAILAVLDAVFSAISKGLGLNC